MSIQFIQYLMPYGMQQRIEIHRPHEIEELAERIRAKGYRFEIEMLQTGHVSMEIVTNDSDPDPIAGEVCHNGPTQGDALGVPECVDRMVRNAAKVLRL